MSHSPIAKVQCGDCCRLERTPNIRSINGSVIVPASAVWCTNRPWFEQEKGIAVLQGGIEVVQNGDDGDSLSQHVAGDVQDMQLIVDVEIGRRLVEEEVALVGRCRPSAQICASTRASCTFCCSPPDSVGYDWCRRVVMPTSSSACVDDRRGRAPMAVRA